MNIVFWLDRYLKIYSWDSSLLVVEFSKIFFQWKVLHRVTKLLTEFHTHYLSGSHRALMKNSQSVRIYLNIFVYAVVTHTNCSLLIICKFNIGDVRLTVTDAHLDFVGDFCISVFDYVVQRCINLSSILRVRSPTSGSLWIDGPESMGSGSSHWAVRAHCRATKWVIIIYFYNTFWSKLFIYIFYSHKFNLWIPLYVFTRWLFNTKVVVIYTDIIRY